MNKISGLLGLPQFGLNSLCLGFAGLTICWGFSIARAPETDVKWANVRVITSTSAIKLDHIAEDLEQKTQVVQQNALALEELKLTYDSYLTNQVGGIELDEAFNAIKELPPVEDTEELLSEIDLVESELSEVLTEPD